MNNPLKYIDPSGNTWKIFKWIKESSINSFILGQDITVFVTAPTAGFLTGFIDKAFNNRGDGTWFGAGFNNGKDFTINGFKINAGVSDALSTESQSTIFGAVPGALTSQYFNYTNQVVEVKSFYGTTVVRLRTDKVDYAMTPVFRTFSGHPL